MNEELTELFKGLNSRLDKIEHDLSEKKKGMKKKDREDDDDYEDDMDDEDKMDMKKKKKGRHKDKKDGHKDKKSEAERKIIELEVKLEMQKQLSDIKGMFSEGKLSAAQLKLAEDAESPAELEVIKKFAETQDGLHTEKLSSSGEGGINSGGGGNTKEDNLLKEINKSLGEDKGSKNISAAVSDALANLSEAEKDKMYLEGLEGEYKNMTATRRG